MDPTADSPETAVALTLGQLEDRLQLAMAAREQLRQSQTVHRAFVQTSMEAYGLELPTHMPAHSFTIHPSKTNYDALVRVMDVQIDQMVTQYNEQHANVIGMLQDIVAAFNQRVQNLSGTLPTQHLQVALSCWENLKLDALRASEEPLVQGELARVDQIVQWWSEEGKELGQLVLQPESDLYRDVQATYDDPGGDAMKECIRKIGVWKFSDPTVPSSLDTLVQLLRVLPADGLPTLLRTLPMSEDRAVLETYQSFIDRIAEVVSLREAILDQSRSLVVCLGTLHSLQAE